MWNLLRDGTIWGIGLSFLIGPIFFALIQAGISRGFKAAIILSAGVWLSDLIYIVLSYSGVSFLIELIQQEHFKEYTGILGGLILVGSGIATLFNSKVEDNSSAMNINKLSNVSLFLKGFFVNTFNPFTIFFWIALNTSQASQKAFSVSEAAVFFGSLWGTIVLTDVMKAFLAKKIKEVIKDHHIVLVRKGCAIALIIFGIVLALRSVFPNFYSDILTFLGNIF
jgi:threonine/homoserine/homoserine lactone efflux protein